MKEYTKERPLRVFEAFAGYSSQRLALERLKRAYPEFDYISVGISEIDSYAIKANLALFPDTENYGDISKIKWEDVPDFDLFTYSSPCQDFQVPDFKKVARKVPALVAPFCGSVKEPSRLKDRGFYCSRMWQQ